MRGNPYPFDWAIPPQGERLTRIGLQTKKKYL
jgi:hypothetical protein